MQALNENKYKIYFKLNFAVSNLLHTFVLSSGRWQKPEAREGSSGVVRPYFTDLI
jgi:hypothetical protein